jgi:hypothetical protein
MSRPSPIDLLNSSTKENSVNFKILRNIFSSYLIFGNGEKLISNLNLSFNLTNESTN